MIISVTLILAIVTHPPFEREATLTDWLVRNERQNKSYAYNHQVPTARRNRAMRISHAGKLPANEALAKAAPTAAM